MHRSGRRFQLHPLRAALGAALSVFAAEAADPPAPEPLYTVELVVFRALTPLGVAEDWSVQVAQGPATGEEGPAGEPEAETALAVADVPVQPIASAQFRLAGTEAALRRHAAYEVLAHVGWTQPTTTLGAGAGTGLAQLGVQGALRGQVALEQGRYLHLKLDLAFTPHDPPTSLLGSARGTGPVTFALKQKRRVRPFEPHYFDHPAFGVIAVVTPAG